MSESTGKAAANGVKHLYVVDGSGYIFRAYFGLKTQMSTPDGTPTGAAYGFTNMLMKLMRENEADGLLVVFDAGKRSFRNDIYDDYKANRPEPPEDLIPQFPIIREATRAFGLPCLELENYEADDIIATLARRGREAGIRVTIVSSDKDLMQLVTDGVDMLDPIKGTPIGPEQVQEKFGVTPDKVVEVQALAGDSVDNIPGVPGIGLKTAAELIATYGDVETLLSRAEEIKQPKRRERLIENAEQARVSRQLVQLDRDVPLDYEIKDFVKDEPDPDELRAFLEKYEFRSIINRLSDLLGEAPEPVRERKEPVGYSLVTKLSDLEDWIARAREQGWLAVDTETTSLDPQQAHLVGVSLSLEAESGCYIPLAHRNPKAEGLDFDQAEEGPQQVDFDKALVALKDLLEDDSVLKIGQNLKYDMRVLSNYGIRLTPFDDTMLLSYVLEGGLHGHGMDELAELHLGHRTISYKEVAGSGKSQVTFDLVPLDKALDYAAEDADITLRLWEAFKPRLVPEKLTTVYETLERPLVDVLCEMELTGIKVDRDRLRRQSNDFAQRIETLEEEIYKLAGRRFTIGSPKQLGEVLFDEMGLDGGGKRGKSGSYSTGADILEGLANQGHDLPARVLDWRQLSKLKSTYTDALQSQINEKTGRVHTTFSQAVASTGRLSSNDPNLQNIPIRTEEGRKIREAFVAEEGHTLLSVDYSQIELRLTAHIAEEDSLRQAFADGQDIHAMTASQVFGVPLADMDPATRRRAKAINFGIIYGISPFGLANNLGIAQSDAKSYIEAYFEQYPNIRAYMDNMKKLAREQGYVSTLFGRRIHVPALKEKNPARRSFGERAAINAPIQGTAADIIKRAMIRVQPALEAEKLKARLVLQVHDELLFEVPDAELEATTKVVTEVMEKACDPVVQLSVPLVAEAGHGPSWSEAH
ncbi:DNA polymerase I [Fodinicurvata fenggangensis]|uniref:DNA polymerase I n=1 Tax=Fodinicurvata fenggangensis TaxID=1121830 RepID=UPI00068EB0B8|nr:DNA polymerase I [Fodinicurvata fenggangensis]